MGSGKKELAEGSVVRVKWMAGSKLVTLEGGPWAGEERALARGQEEVTLTSRSKGEVKYVATGRKRGAAEVFIHRPELPPHG